MAPCYHMKMEGKVRPAHFRGGCMQQPVHMQPQTKTTEFMRDVEFWYMIHSTGVVSL